MECPGTQARCRSRLRCTPSLISTPISGNKNKIHEALTLGQNTNQFLRKKEQKYESTTSKTYVKDNKVCFTTLQKEGEENVYNGVFIYFILISYFFTIIVQKLPKYYK